MTSLRQLEAGRPMMDREQQRRVLEEQIKRHQAQLERLNQAAEVEGPPSQFGDYETGTSR